MTGKDLSSGAVVIGATAVASTGKDLYSAAVVTGEYSCATVCVNLLLFCSVDLFSSALVCPITTKAQISVLIHHKKKLTGQKRY
jgi:hypothetical protein